LIKNEKKRRMERGKPCAAKHAARAGSLVFRRVGIFFDLLPEKGSKKSGELTCIFGAVPPLPFLAGIVGPVCSAAPPQICRKSVRFVCMR